jgi:hypothetical protein
MGIIRALFGRRNSESSRVSALAMSMIPHVRPPDVGSVIAWVREQFDDCPPIGDPQGSEHTFTAEIPGGQIGFTHVPAPIPSGDLDGPIAFAWHWPTAAEVIADHTAHEICFASSTVLNSIELHLLHSRVIAGVVEISGASGVYVGSSLLAREAEKFLADIKEGTSENLPLLSWLGFNPVAGESTRSGYTTGMRDFGMLELEIRDSALEWAKLLECLANIAHYELISGLQIGDGETVGSSESERIEVHHTESIFIPDTRVAWIAT